MSQCCVHKNEIKINYSVNKNYYNNVVETIPWMSFIQYKIPLQYLSIFLR